MAEQETATDETVTEVATDAAVETTDENKAEIPAEVKRALQKANKEAETLRLKLKEFEDRDKTEAERLQERAEAAEARATELEIENLRRDVAAEKGLTPAQARRLVGTTRDELEADADDFLESIPKSGFGDVGQGHRGTTSNDPAEQFAAILRRQRGN